MRHLVKFVSLLIAGSLLVSASLACGSDSTPEVELPTAALEEESASPQDTAEPTALPQATHTPAPTKVPDTPEPPAPGLSRANPFPRDAVVSAPHWDVQVLETTRGEDAWTDIHEANMFNEPAPEGMEYILVKVWVKSTYADDEEHNIGSCDFDLTGNRLIRYTCSTASVVAPEPRLDATLFAGGESEGWIAFPVGQGETDLVLIVNELFSFDEDSTRYVALDDGASIPIDPELAIVRPSNVGTERSNPAPFTEMVTTEDWEISLLDVVAGNDAWLMVQDANQFNDPPEDGMQYVLVKVHTRYIGTDEGWTSMDGSSFRATGSAGVLYDQPYVVAPDPRLDISLFPGGEYEGWVAVTVAEGELNTMLVFEPLFDFSGNNRRYISLER